MHLFERRIKETALFLLGECREVKNSFSKSTETIREAYLNAIISKRDAMLCSILDKKSSHAISGHSERIEMLYANVKSYASLCNWNFIDLTFFLACVDSVDDELIERIAKLSLIYQAFRMVDDVLDGHVDYKGEGTTLYGRLMADHASSGQAVAASILPALLMLSDGLFGIHRKYIDLTMKTVVGALWEAVGEPIRTFEQYTAMVDGKMTAYGMLLYGPVIDTLDIQQKERMGEIMRSTFICSQIANDLVDRTDDAKRGQPNFWHILDSDEACGRLIGMLQGLYEERRRISCALQPYLLNRLYDICHYIISGLPA